MYIKRVSISNIRGFEQIDLDLTVGDDTKPWTLILGDNGLGKTTLLRAIAVGLCDTGSASGLLDELYGEWIREPADGNEGLIRIEFSAPPGQVGPIIEKIFRRAPSGDLEISQTATDFPWRDLFVCAYGAARRVTTSPAYDEYSVVDAVYSLFNYDSSLQDPELAVRRLGQASGGDTTEILERLDKLLLLEPGSVDLQPSGLRITGRDAVAVPLRAAPDGYQVTLGWTLDLFAWWMLSTQNNWTSDIKGVVLVDELERHLHPRWQRVVIKRLHEQFPHVQFIVTSHAPLCAIGTTELSDEECSLFLMERIDHSVVASGPLPPPRNSRVDQVLTSYLFGLYTTGDNDTQGEIAEFANLISVGPHTAAEERRVVQLRSALSKKLGAPEAPFQEKVERALRDVLATQAPEIPDEAAVFEIRRQMADIFGTGDHSDQG